MTDPDTQTSTVTALTRPGDCSAQSLNAANKISSTNNREQSNVSESTQRIPEASPFRK